MALKSLFVIYTQKNVLEVTRGNLPLKALLEVIPLIDLPLIVEVNTSKISRGKFTSMLRGKNTP